ncbi:hypothetical protein N7474_009183 [Penicillium riverlandense]|uniref:uncharacterized protein n=1 Tax=Penicillium riverlandense TaxID=1903569 RepID=UPI002546A481|nr:uncharacterized protein N7474_009183 [Penicillium riverlandense]KAJ5807914.1 hypothetical protein N7474_009183 [Penicillium riverlandense]
MLGLGENLIHLFEAAAGGLGKQEVDERNHANVEPSEDDEVTPSDSLECSGSDFGDQNKERDSSESKGVTEMKEEGENDSPMHREFVFWLRPQAAYQCHADGVSGSAGQHQAPTPKSFNSQNAHSASNWTD